MFSWSRDVGWCSGKGRLESKRLGFWSPHLSHGDNSNNPAKGFFWESNELQEALCIYFVCVFVSFRNCSYLLESNRYQGRGPGLSRDCRHEGHWLRVAIGTATWSCQNLQCLWGMKQCSHGKGLSETKWRPGLFHLPQRPLSPTAACQQQMYLVDMCFAANKKQ